MKQLLIGLISFLSVNIVAYSQSHLVGTLIHEGQITTFYGATALQEAHKAAVAGDVINLSSGAFAATNITKAVTIRGAGMVFDSITQSEPTVIMSDFEINVTKDETNGDHKLTLEGIYHNGIIDIGQLEDAIFLKSRFRTIHTKSIFKNLNCLHCRIANQIDFSSESTATFIGCVVRPLYTIHPRLVTFINCVTYSASAAKGEYKNCIIIEKRETMFPDQSTYFNNLLINSNNISLTSTNNTNITVFRTDERVASLVGLYYDGKTYKLNDEIRALIKGTDGTEVGIYGGSLPYDPTPTNPQIKKFNVASKTTADGKLSVDIEVSSAE